MTPPQSQHPDIREHQDLGHHEDYDYAAVSPHIRHSWVRDTLIGTLREELLRLARDDRPLRVLEVGAGHGTFTDHLVALGAHVTITEMSSASAAKLEQRYTSNPAIRVHLDVDADLSGLDPEGYDVVVVVAVLHHIPDYLAALDAWADHMTPGGTLITLQDPLWYPRRPRWQHVGNRAAHFAWRIFQDDLLEGFKSLARRGSHRYDEANPRDMVEYHVLRQGVDEQAVVRQLEPRFGEVRLMEYWSTQSGLLQHVGDRIGLLSSFGVVARDRH